MRQFCICLMISLLTGGCERSLSYSDYFNYFNRFEQGSFIVDSSNTIIYKLQLRSDEFNALIDLRAHKIEVNKGEIKKRLESSNDDALNFCLRMSSNKGSILDKNDPAYYEKVFELSNGFAQLIHGITENGDTIYCDFSHFERSYGVQPFVQILFSMPQPTESDLKKVRYRDVIFNNGQDIQFDITQYVNDLPNLKL